MEHQVEVGNMERNEELFMEKMGFAHDSEGLELTEEQLVNFLLLCHQMEYGVGAESEDEEEGDVKVKVMKVFEKAKTVMKVLERAMTVLEIVVKVLEKVSRYL